MIDRKKLIEELCNQYQKYNLDTWNEAIDRAIQIVESQPKISLENKTSDNMHCACSGQVWIPCSERLPETDNENTHKFDVLCYVPKVEGNYQHGVYIGKLRYVKGDYDGSKNVWGIQTEDCNWTLWGWSYFEHPTVVAWMPLPKAYEVQDETN